MADPVTVIRRRVLVSRVQDIWTAQELLNDKQKEWPKAKLHLEPGSKVQGVQTFNIVQTEKFDLEVPDEPAQLPIPYPEIKPSAKYRGVPYYYDVKDVKKSYENNKAVRANTLLRHNAQKDKIKPVLGRWKNK